MPPRGKRMSAEERRAQILAAVVPLFAHKGFSGVRTKELAVAAGISEALIYRHFPSKEALYSAILEQVHRAGPDNPRLLRYVALAPSTEKLVLGIHLLVSHLAQEGDDDELVLPRLMLFSLLDDGKFAWTNMRSFQSDWFAVLQDALDAAGSAGDLVADGPAGPQAWWLAHHLGFALRCFILPGPVIDYGISRAELAFQATRFVLRGIGLTDAALTRYFVPDRLERLLD